MRPFSLFLSLSSFPSTFLFPAGAVKVVCHARIFVVCVYALSAQCVCTLCAFVAGTHAPRYCAQCILQGSDKETEGYQEIPYGGCERLQDPPDACYCLFISGLIPP